MLMIPLQDTTGEMGATCLCPDTHRCDLGDEDCEDWGEGGGQALYATVGGTGVLMHRTFWI